MMLDIQKRKETIWIHLVKRTHTTALQHIQHIKCSLDIFRSIHHSLPGHFRQGIPASLLYQTSISATAEAFLKSRFPFKANASKSVKAPFFSKPNNLNKYCCLIFIFIAMSFGFILSCKINLKTRIIQKIICSFNTLNVTLL